ncbi:hypothetical protein A2Z67_05010 [Candidatus Woesebacteria bacterium RBG_13_36_22]|uniref:Uncharacterized protein n=1 Tax=Candidatus Woesebacteria bacterium RBG_13_36_22 TaxID=1802478 RepID=A0A1F7X2S0_9BACT|nr:MAG: hypothetical protein A2Z67_05010 [Candidatus Woesebacteria bacterium RBG_13_36_22]
MNEEIIELIETILGPNPHPDAVKEILEKGYIPSNWIPSFLRSTPDYDGSDIGWWVVLILLGVVGVATLGYLVREVLRDTRREK